MGEVTACLCIDGNNQEGRERGNLVMQETGGRLAGVMSLRS